MATTGLNKELLFDAIILLFDECNNEFLKTDSLISDFVNKCEYSISHNAIMGRVTSRLQITSSVCGARLFMITPVVPTLGVRSNGQMY